MHGFNSLLGPKVKGQAQRSASLSAAQRLRCAEDVTRMFHRKSDCANVNTSSLLPSFDSELVCVPVAESRNSALS